MQVNYSAPFAITDINHGLQEAKGLLKVTDEGLEFEFEVKDTLIGFFKSGLKKVHIPYKKLVSVHFEKGLIHSKIKLEGVSMRAFSELPGVDVVTCELKIKRKDRKEAARLVSKARAALSEYKLNNLGD